MQIFCPYANPKKTAKVLDNKRLNKQILEVIQILSANTGIDVGWKIPKYIKNHPTSLLWKNANLYLIDYLGFIFDEYKKRKNKIHKCKIIFYIFFTNMVFSPNNLKHLTPEFCKKYQQILLKKDYNYYSKYFN